MILKKDIRKHFIILRSEISIIRRSLASKKLLKILNLNFSNILSFASKSKEINTWLLNQKLCQENKLLLPRVYKNELEIYRMKDLKNELVLGKFNILEPNPKICNKIAKKKIECVLVPGVAFDNHNNRIGFGKGYYDRFLKDLDAPKIGIGFLEQLYDGKLPKSSHDVKLDHLYLF